MSTLKPGSLGVFPQTQLTNQNQQTSKADQIAWSIATSTAIGFLASGCNYGLGYWRNGSRLLLLQTLSA